MRLLHFMAVGLILLASPGFSQSARQDSSGMEASLLELEDAMFEDYPVGLSRAEKLLSDATRSDCKSCTARAHRLVGRFYWANGEYPKGIKEFHTSLRLARQSNLSKTEASVLDLIGNTYYYQAYYDSALFYFEKALSVYKQQGDVQGMIIVLHDISLMFHRQGNFSKAIEYLFREEQQKNLLPASLHSVEAMGAMGSLMVDSIHYWDVIKNETELVIKYRSENNRKAEFRTYFNIGKAYRQMADHLSAARYFVKSAQVMEQIGWVPEWDQAAIDYRDANVPDSAFYYHHKARQYFPRMTQPAIAYTIELLGDAHKYFRNFDSARFYYYSALHMNYRMNNRITFTGIHRHLTNVHTNLGDFEAAERHLETGLELASTIALIHERNLMREGKHLYETKGDFKKALYYSERYRVLQDSIHRAETAINLTKLQAEFKSAQKAKEVDDLRQQSLLNEAQLGTRNLQIALAISLLVIAAAVGGWYYSRYRQKSRTSRILEEQKKMIEVQNANLSRQNRINEALLSEIHHRVKNNLQIISSLINLKSRHTSPETSETLLQLGNRIFTMGLIHEKLYRTEDVQTVRLDVYLKELTDHLLQSLGQREKQVHSSFECDAIEIEADRALACGLICNELITNSLKYAFTPTQDTCEIGVSLTRKNGHLKWVTSDNGEASVQTGTSTSSFGLRFVEQLVKSKLAGTWEVEMNVGFKATIDMPVHA